MKRSRGRFDTIATDNQIDGSKVTLLPLLYLASAIHCLFSRILEGFFDGLVWDFLDAQDPTERLKFRSESKETDPVSDWLVLLLLLMMMFTFFRLNYV